MQPNNGPQEYTVKQFKVGDFRDANNNVWCDMVLEGVGEPVRIVVKDPSQYQDGMKLWGHIQLKQSQAGRTYQRFYRDQRQQTFTGNGPVQVGQVVAKKEWQPESPEKQDSIARSVALKAAVDFMVNLADVDVKSSMNRTLNIAGEFLAWLQGSNSGSAGTTNNSISGTTQAVRTPVQAATPEYSPDLGMPFEGDYFPPDDVPIEYR